MKLSSPQVTKQAVVEIHPVLFLLLWALESRFLACHIVLPVLCAHVGGRNWETYLVTWKHVDAIPERVELAVVFFPKDGLRPVGET